MDALDVLAQKFHDEMVSHGCKYSVNGSFTVFGMPLDIHLDKKYIVVTGRDITMSMPLNYVGEHSYVDLVGTMIKQMDSHIANSNSKIEAQVGWVDEH